MRQIIYEVMGAESGATLTEYRMFAYICANSVEFTAAVLGARWPKRIGRSARQSDRSLNLKKE